MVTLFAQRLLTFAYFFATEKHVLTFIFLSTFITSMLSANTQVICNILSTCNKYHHCVHKWYTIKFYLQNTDIKQKPQFE